MLSRIKCFLVRNCLQWGFSKALSNYDFIITENTSQVPKKNNNKRITYLQNSRVFKEALITTINLSTTKQLEVKFLQQNLADTS